MATLTGSSAPSPHAADSDEDLLIYMGMRSEGPVVARAAWNEFYIRHAPYLYKECKRSFSSLGEPIVQETVQQVFLKAYESAETYDCGGLKGDDARRNVRAWLGRIARNVFIDALRRQPITIPLENNGSTSEVDIIDRDGKWWDSSDVPEPRRVKLLREALETLSDREKDILRITAMWYHPGRAQQRIPSADLQRLAYSLQTTAANIRQIRKRAIEKVKDYIESRENQH